MQVTQEKRPGSRIGFSFVIPAEQVKRGYDKTLRQISSASDIPGFRKGKAPLAMVIRSIGKERLKAAALEDLLETSVKKAVKEAQISPLTSFEVDGGTDGLLAAYNPEADLSFSGSVEIYPEVVLGDYRGLSVQVERVEPDYGEDVDQRLERLREDRATLIPISDRPAQMGDVVILDFTATFEDGSPVEGSTSHDFDLVMEPGNLYPGFCEGIVGMGIDDIKEIVVTVPEPYFDPNLAGKTLKFRVTLNDLKARELPDLDDSFAQAVSSFSTLEELNSYLRKRSDLNALRQCESNAQDAVVNAIMRDLAIEIPDSLVEKETISMITRTFEQLKTDDQDTNEGILATIRERWSELSSQVKPEATSRLLRSMVVSEVIRREQIEVGETELNVALDEYIQNNRGKVTQESLKETAQNLYQTLLISKALRWLVSQNQITWVDKEGHPVEDPLTPPAIPDLAAGETELLGSDSEAFLVTSGVVEAEFTGESDSDAAVIEVAAAWDEEEAKPEAPESMAESIAESVPESSPAPTGVSEPDQVSPEVMLESSEAGSAEGTGDTQEEPSADRDPE